MSRDLKPEHSLVLEAIGAANQANQRVATIAEISKAFTPKEIARLRAVYDAKDLSTLIRKIVDLLRARGLVFTPGKIGKHRYYGSVNVLDPQTSSLPTIQSRRQRVLTLVRNAVAHYSRAARIVDIFEYAATDAEVSGLSQADITHDVLSLVETEELRVIGATRGGNGGINLYLPRELDEERYKPTEPLTWLEEVAKAITSFWSERAKHATARGQRPCPLSTGEIRAHLATLEFKHQPNLSRDGTQLIIDAVKFLSSTSDPVLRRIKRPKEKTLLWVPVWVKDEDLDLGDAYTNDGERIGEAVKRAQKRLGRPVNVRDISEEVEFDPSLRPAGASSLFMILSDQAKETLSHGVGKGRRGRITRRVFRAGRLGGDAYYCMENLPEAQAWIKFRQLELKWRELDEGEQLDALDTLSISSIAVGRAMLFATAVESLLEELNGLRRRKQANGATRRACEELRGAINGVAQGTREWLAEHAKDAENLPSAVSTVVPAWTSQELLEFIRPFYPQAQKITSTKLITLMGNEIRRVSNPHFESRFDEDQHSAAEFLYDRTDALIYSAKQWGGYECCMQAMLAGSELGWLRDPRFIFPALELDNFENRLTGVSCLAFLQSEEGNALLRHLATADPYPGVRQSALWAYGFAVGDKASELVRKVVKNEKDFRVKEFAKEMLDKGSASWWTM